MIGRGQRKIDVFQVQARWPDRSEGTNSNICQACGAIEETVKVGDTGQACQGT